MHVNPFELIPISAFFYSQIVKKRLQPISDSSLFGIIKSELFNRDARQMSDLSFLSFFVKSLTQYHANQMSSFHLSAISLCDTSEIRAVFTVVSTPLFSVLPTRAGLKSDERH